MLVFPMSGLVQSAVSVLDFINYVILIKTVFLVRMKAKDAVSLFFIYVLSVWSSIFIYTCKQCKN